jgi:Undecaprenyl-phosphate glucose phosphotransferase
MKPNKDIFSSLGNSAVLRELPRLEPQHRREQVLSNLPDTAFVSPQVLAVLLRVLEGGLVALIGLINLIRFPGLEKALPPTLYGSVVLFSAICFPLILNLSGSYRLTALLNPMRQITSLSISWFTTFAFIAVFAFVAKVGADISRNWLLTWFASGLLIAFSFRFFTSHFMRRMNTNGQLNRRAVLVGGGPPADHVIATLNASRDTGLTLLGVFDDRGDDRAPITSKGLSMLGSVDDLIDFVRSTRIDTLIITLPVTAENRLLQILKQLWVLPVDIRLSAQDQRVRYRPRAYSYIGNLALLDLFDRPLGDWGPYLKTVSDKIIATIAVILLAPVLAAVAIAVKWDSKGPVIFKQKRYGFNNELIEVYKFRSMYTDMSDSDARKLVTKGDPRVTRVGRFIRKTTLDELPQLFNVLAGDLSLVGPRPHATKASAAGNLYESVVDGYFARHKVKPGMTGWAQINGWRGETDTAEKIERRVEHDLYYIENWSLTFDLYILARTPLALFNTEQAY